MTIRQATPSDVASISKKDAAQLLDISVTLLEKLIATGDLPASKIGRAVRIRLRDIDTYLNTHQWVTEK